MCGELNLHGLMCTMPRQLPASNVDCARCDKQQTFIMDSSVDICWMLWKAEQQSLTLRAMVPQAQTQPIPQPLSRLHAASEVQ